MAYGWKFEGFRFRIAGETFNQMKNNRTLCIGLPFFLTLCNAQDDAALTGAATTTPAETAVAMGYAAQGNVAMNEALRKAELQAALQKAREKRATQQAMVNYVQKPEPITTAEQFLAAHRPPMPRSSGPSEAAVASRQRSYVPEFEAQTGRAESAPSVPSESTTTPRKPGLFDRLKWKKSKSQEGNPSFAEMPAPPPSEYPRGMVDSSPAAEGIAPGAVPSSAPAAVAIPDMTQPEKPGFLGRLFKREKESATVLPPSSATALSPATGIAPLATDPDGEPDTVTSGGIPSPPGFDAPTTPSAPAPTAPTD